MMFVCIKTLSSNLISKLRQTHDTRCESWPDTNSKMTKSSILMARRVRFNCSYMYSCFDSSINSTAPFRPTIWVRLDWQTKLSSGLEVMNSLARQVPMNPFQRALIVHRECEGEDKRSLFTINIIIVDDWWCCCFTRCVSRSGRHQTKFDARSTDFHLQRLMSSETAANFYLFNERDVSINAGFVGNCTTLSPLKAS